MPSLTQTMRRCAPTAVLGLWLGACGPADGGQIELSVVDDRGEALAEVAIRADGELLARSDVAGKARLTREHLNARTTLRADCPEAYRPARQRALAAGPPPRALQFVCRPHLRTLAVVAYAPQAVGALLRADAQSLGRVASDGTLHAVLRRPPGASFELKLEVDPPRTRLVQVRDRDEIIVMDGER